MARESCIEHPKGVNFAMIKGAYVSLFNGDHGIAAVLWCLEYYTNNRLDLLDAAEQSGDPWFDASISKISDQLTGLYGRMKIMKALEILAAYNLVEINKTKLGSINRYLLNVDYLNDLIKRRAVIQVDLSRVESRNGLEENTNQSAPESAVESAPESTFGLVRGVYIGREFRTQNSELDLYTDQVSFLRIWSTVRGLKKPSRGDRARIAENWSDIKASEDAIYSGLTEFSAWLKTATDVHSPLQLFLRNPDKWIPDDPTPTSHPAPPAPGVLPGSGGAAPSSTQEAVAGVVAPLDTPEGTFVSPPPPVPHWRDAWLSVWNGYVTAMPVSEWDASDDRKLAAASQDPEFTSRFHEICGQSQKIHVNKSDCGYLTLQWVISPQREDPDQLNWRKLFKSMAFMAKPQQMSRSGQSQHIDMKEVIRKAVEKNFPKKVDE